MELRDALRSTASLRDFTDERIGDDVLIRASAGR